MEILKDFGVPLVAGLLAIIAYFLRQRDDAQARQLEAQAHQIAVLFAKHDEDANKLQLLELKVASEHYVKPELDGKFDKLERTFSDGLKELGSKFDNLATVLVEHITKGAK